ncbi:DUF6653 family protein [Brevibacterium sp. FME37]|uniref:DUF6653 family protein n=1 Tax=Brevibacterium sp. FME37 TaxID=2742607 RepID=UPI001869673B|nr:DUF6653 family protein [Brevibacterium sp. FME37]
MKDRTNRPGATVCTDFAQLKRWIFARHSNPLSAWSRWASVPLVVLPFWKRSPWVGAAVAAWMVLNPIVFRSPRDERAWATRAMLGEELWSERLRFDRASTVNAVSTAAMAVSIAGAWRKSVGQTVPAVVVQMSLTLVFWKLMTDFYATIEEAGRSTT